MKCLHAGCNSIWIVANDDVAPLLRHRLGEVATDIDSIQRGTFAKFGQTKHLEVPIYYVPIHPKHRDKGGQLCMVGDLWGQRGLLDT